MKKRFQHKIEFIALKSLIVILNLVPAKLAIRFGDAIGFLAFSILRIRRQVTLSNLKKSFGGRYYEKQYREIGLRSFINFARSMIEYGLFPSLVKRDLSRKIKVEGEEPLRRHIQTGAGAVLIAGHFGSWELMGAYLSRMGIPIDFLVGIQHNLLVNKLMNRHRMMFGIGLIEIGVAARGVFTAIKKGRVVAMLSDQDAGDDGVIVNFLGRPASTPKGPAAFALKTDCPIFVASFVRVGLDRHIMYLDGPITVQKTGDKEENIKRLTQAYSDVICRYISEYPDHWFWAHRRWKSTCPDDYRW